jgi:hypothetical protein
MIDEETVLNDRSAPDEGTEAAAEPEIVDSSPAARRPWVDLLLVGLLVVATLWRLLPAVSTTPFHRDEARWLSNSNLLREWRHPLSAKWQDEGYPNVYGTIDEKNRRRSQLPFAMYVLGIGVYLQQGELPTNGYWIMSQDNEWNAAEGNMPSDGELKAGRRTDVAIALLTVIALYVIGLAITNRVGGVVSALVYALHPLVRDTASRAWSDPLLVLFAALAALAGYRLAQRPTWGRALLFGAALGLGGATKLSPLLVAVAVGVLGLVILLWQVLRRQGEGQLTRLALWMVAAPFIAYATFVAVYPYLWTDPIEHTRRMIEFRTDSFDLQGVSFPAAKVEDRADALRRVGDELGERFSIGGAIAEAIDQDGWSSLRNLDLAVAVAGWLIILGWVVTRGLSRPPLFMAMLVAIQAAAVIFGIGVEYARYLLPVVLAIAVGIGATFGTAWEIAWSRILLRRLSPPAERRTPGAVEAIG